jgi:hypothetical protein
MGSHYINTDLIIRTSADACSLVARLARSCDLLYGELYEDERWHMAAEARCASDISRTDRSPEIHVRRLLDALEALPPEELRLVRGAEVVEFNIGWQAAADRPEGVFALAPPTLARISALGASLVVTVYPSSEDDPEWGPVAPPLAR